MYREQTGRSGWVWVVLGVTVAILAVVVALLLLGLSGSLGTSPRAPFFGVWGGFLLLFLLLWITFFVVRVVFWTRRVGRFYGRPGYGAGNSAIAIVRQRYARGEITREQYDQLMTDLTRRRVPP